MTRQEPNITSFAMYQKAREQVVEDVLLRDYVKNALANRGLAAEEVCRAMTDLESLHVSLREQVTSYESWMKLRCGLNLAPNQHFVRDEVNR